MLFPSPYFPAYPMKILARLALASLLPIALAGCGSKPVGSETTNRYEDGTSRVLVNARSLCRAKAGG